MDVNARTSETQSSLAQSRVCSQCGLTVSFSVTRCPNDGTSLLTKSEIGTELASQYEFLSVIASGGMGIIYEARNLVLNQKVAVKMMKTEKLDEKNVKRFKKEAEALAALEHPNIIHVRHYGLTENGQPYMVLDYVEGTSMSQVIQSKGPIPVAFAIQFFIQIADALSHAHERGVWHQDLKPNNIMICQSGLETPYIKLIDFGIAKIINGEATPAGLTDTGDILGSPAYMSPEQASGGRVDSRTDIYSLGCVMFEALTGTQPFSGATALEVIAHQINTKAPSIEDRALSEFPPSLVKIVAKTLEKSVNLRYQSMSELRDALGKVLKEDHEETGQFKTKTTAQNFKDSLNTPKAKTMMMVGIALTLTILFTNICLLITKATREREAAVARKKIKDEAEAANFYDPHTLARQMIREGMLKWRPGGQFRIRVDADDSVLDEFGLYPARATYIDLENSSVKGPGLAYLIRYPVDFLTMNDSSMTDRATLEIKHMKGIQQLQVDNTSITKAGFAQLKGMTRLLRISARTDRLDDETMRVIADIKSLEEVQCGRNDKITATGYAYLKELPHLRILDVMQNPIDVSRAKAISQLPGVEVLNFERTSIDDDGLKEICNMRNLQDLQLVNCEKITGSGLKSITRLSNLRNLKLERVFQLSDQDFAVIGNLPKLRSLDIRRTNVGDLTMEKLSDSPVAHLYIQSTKVTDAGLLKLLNCRYLKTLEVEKSQFSAAAVAQVEKQKPGVLRFFGHDDITDEF
ncbi:MAG: protein kinase [Cyanobacteria bacterium SZAS LIN-5]|nr:protein kinase [Cyanobacteria bacterium SZAS LIN-5]